MGVELDGWIEINTRDRSRLNEDSIHPVVDITLIVERVYKVYGKLFGIRAEDGVVPVASEKGFPPHVSKIVKNALKNNVGITYASLEDIDETLELLCKKPTGEWDECMPGWIFVLNSMRQLGSMFGRQNVRIVVGFDDY